MVEKKDSVQREVESILAKTPFGGFGEQSSSMEGAEKTLSGETESEDISSDRYDRLDKRLSQIELRLNEHRLRSAQESKSQKENLLKLLQESLSPQEVRFSHLHEEIKKLKDELTSTYNDLNSTQKQNQDLQQRMTSLAEEVSAKPDPVQLVEQAKVSILDAFDTHKGRLKAVEDRLLEMAVSLDATKDNLSKQIEKITEQFDDRDCIHVAIQGQLDDLSGIVAQQSNEFTRLLEQYQTENGEMANNLQGTLLEQLAEFQSTVETNREEVQAKLNQQAEALSESLSQLEQQWLQKNTEDALRTEECSQEFEQQKNQIKQLQDISEQLNTKTKNLFDENLALKEWFETDIAESIYERLGFLENEAMELRNVSKSSTEESEEEKSALRERINLLKIEIESHQSQLTTLLERINANESSLQIYNALSGEFESKVNEQKGSLTKIETQLEAVEQNLAEVREEELLFSEELAVIRDEIKRKDVRENLLSPSDYFVFEERFRGTEEEIKQRQSRFVSYFEGCNNVLDIGCGRGEFLHLLKHSGIGASGIDNNPVMVEYCQRHGLQVAVADAFEFLKSLEDSKLDGLYCGQLIEHFTADEQIGFVKLAHQKLRFNSYFIIETMNPLNLPTSATHFYTDLSHKRPVTPDAFSFLLAAVGFRKIEFDSLSDTPEEEKLKHVQLPSRTSTSYKAIAETLNGNMDKINRLLFAYRDLAAIALK